MAENFTFSETGSSNGAADDIAGVKYQKIKVVDGIEDSTTVIEAGGGTEDGALRVTVANNSTGVLSIDDGGNTITIDGTVAPYAQPANFVSGVTSSITNDTATSVIAAQGEGVVTYITSIMVTNGDEDTGDFVDITDGSGGTIKWSGYAAKGGGGFAINFNVPLVFTANTAVYCKCTSGSAAVRVACAGYKV